MKLENGIFVSTLLEDAGITHGFTTRSWGNLGFGKTPGDPEVVANRKALFGALLLTERNHIQPRQVHSSRGVSSSDFEPGIEADATFTGSKEDLLSVLTADCLPLLVYHPVGVAAAIHAGWRGLYDGIIPNALSMLPPDPLIAVGPAIGPCCYEIGEDLAQQFQDKFGSEVIVREEGRKPHLDLQRAAFHQLQDAGITDVEIANLCTFCHSDLFFSYRRDGSSGRMMSFIGL
jgi:purine-nucleoside/S-methyl-5'-thioadenosine phosphorylase / adenosine deaminase